MNSEIFSILSAALKRAADRGKKPCNPRPASVSDKKVIANLCQSSDYHNYVREHSINEVTILMNIDDTTVYAEVAKLSILETKELRQLWKEHFKTVPPTNAKKKTLVENLAYSIREKALGGMSKPAQEKLAIYKERYKKGEPILGNSQNYELIPGMVLTREYGGIKYAVKILEDSKVE
jgi:hypothetical protein